MKAHGTPPRGLHAASRSPMFEGRFGFMFPHLKAASYGATPEESAANLLLLGEAMQADPDKARDGLDEEESSIPALYTYFGQFIDHDLTFGPEGSFQQKRDVDALIDFRSPSFDLDCVYGRGPDDQPYMYERNGAKFLLGGTLNGGNPRARDLARSTPNDADPARALLGDKRNDENVIVSQLQGLFLRFHNRLVDQGCTFEQAQHQLQFHYQYVILNDFLPKIIDAAVLGSLKCRHGFDRHRLSFYELRKNAFMPVEFAAAAYRFGHSMIRPGYRLNDKVLLPLFADPTVVPPEEDLRGFRKMNSDWGIDWARFIDTEIRPYGTGTTPPTPDDQKRLQFAYRLDTSLVGPLTNLPSTLVGNQTPTNPISLPQRNLLRSLDFGLPSGQAVAKHMHVRVLEDHEIILGKAIAKNGDPTGGDPKAKAITKVANGAFNGNCPLWTYVLAEAIQHQTEVQIPVKEGVKINSPRLGPVGGHIVAETFIGLMFADDRSLLSTDPHWIPKGGPHYGLRDFVLYAIGQDAGSAKGAGR